MYKDILTGFGEICVKEILPNARTLEEDGFKFENGSVSSPKAFTENVQLLTESGYMGLILPRKFGGLQMSNVANLMAVEIITAADAGMSTLVSTQELGATINKYGSEEQKKKYLPGLASGDRGAAMLLTEPNHESDLQNVITRGEKQNGVCFVTGIKHLITQGIEHSPGGQIFLTVVRTVNKADGSLKQGAGGLSLVLVESCDAEIISLEHKLGIHSSPTVQLSMENAPGD